VHISYIRSYGPFKDQKKSTKAKLRGAQRREIALQRNMNMEEIMNAQFRDSKTFYKLVNSYRKRPSVQIEELIVGGETYTTPGCQPCRCYLGAQLGN
jgi:hypothetical protein